MQRSKAWQSRTALFVAMGLASSLAIPLSLANSVQAVPDPYLVGQRFPDSWRSTLPAGTYIPVAYEDEEADRIVLTPDETVPVTLVVTEDVRTNSGRVVIPRGSFLEGELQPEGNGTQFVAEYLVVDDYQNYDRDYDRNDDRDDDQNNDEDDDRNNDENNDQDETRYEIDAVSNVVTEREVITERSDPDILRGAAIGGAAAAILSEIFGRIDAWEVLAGAGVGVLAEVLLRGSDEVEVIVVRPDELDVRLTSSFELNQY